MINRSLARFKKRELIYTILTLPEKRRSQQLTDIVLRDPEVIQAIEKYHQHEERCAVVTGWGRGNAVTVAERREVIEAFPFPTIMRVLDTYKPDEEICMIFVRQHRVAISLVGF